MTTPWSGTLALEESTRNTPPGWKPGMQRYSVRKYLQNLSIWWRTKNEADESIAAVLVLSRLQGGVRKQALRFTVERDGMNHVGENAFALPAIAADPQRGVDAEPS